MVRTSFFAIQVTTQTKIVTQICLSWLVCIVYKLFKMLFKFINLKESNMCSSFVHLIVVKVIYFLFLQPLLSSFVLWLFHCFHKYFWHTQQTWKAHHQIICKSIYEVMQILTILSSLLFRRESPISVEHQWFRWKYTLVLYLFIHSLCFHHCFVYPRQVYISPNTMKM